MKKNKIIKYIFIALILLFFGCSKFDYDDDSVLQNINSTINLEELVIGCYAKFAEILTDHPYRNNYICQIVPGDDIDIVDFWNICDLNDNIGYFDTYDEDSTPIKLDYGTCRYLTDNQVNNAINGSYKKLYKAIVSQNHIISQLTEKNEINNLFRNKLGEVYFMRAYCYYRLVRVFGEVPLILNNDVNYNISCSSFKEIYNQIELDLLAAISLLPLKKSPSTVCPNRGSAKALLAEVYLTMGGYPIHDRTKYSLSAKYAREVIDSASYFGFELLTDFADLFNKQFETNSESLSAIIYKSEFDTLNPDFVPVFNSNQLSYNMFEPCAEVSFYNKFPINQRKKITFNGYINMEFYDYSTFQVYYRLVYPVQITSSYFLELKKSSEDLPISYFLKNENMTIYVLRYAHTLLTYAEASARSGNLNDLSFEAINMVRRRANQCPIYEPSKYDLSNHISAELFLDSVVWERAWEFVGEPESRWFDLLRLELVESAYNQRDIHEAEPILDLKNGNYFFPIPDEDHLLNTNLSQK